MWWTLWDWLREFVDVVWPLPAGWGLLMLLAAYVTRQVNPDEPEQAYRWMRAAALSFLLSFFLLWLKWRRFM